jgi:hypothetical protein
MPNCCKTVTEIVIYRVIPDLAQQFLQAHTLIIDELSKLPGFLSMERMYHIEQANTYVDQVTWQCKEDALAAFAAFKALPHAKKFMNTIAEVLYSGHFSSTKASELNTDIDIL